MPLAVDYGYLYLELEDFQELGYTESIENGNVLANEETSFFPQDRMGMGY